MAVELPATLQTWKGMVQNSGRPQLRPLPKDFADLEPIRSTWIYPKPDQPRHPRLLSAQAVTYIRSELTVVPTPYNTKDHECFDWTANLAACKITVTTEHLKSYMRMRTRLDLEQAAAVVISAFVTAGRKDNAVRLFEETSEIMKTSCMWIDHLETIHDRKVDSKGTENVSRKLQIAAAKNGVEIPLATSISELIPCLMRVRRSKPDNRCLMIPQWMFDEAQISAPPHFAASFSTTPPDQFQYPLASPPPDAIIVSRHHFNVYQSKIFAMFRFWRPEINLRSRINKIANDVLYGSSYLDSRVFDTDDVALLTHYFFAFQRRMQRKVVSTKSGDEFLAKGEGMGVYQNNLRMKSTFEVVLESIVDESSEGILVVMGPDDTLDLINQTCHLMKEYVDIYGSGSTSNLTFNKGEIGGGGRGPVDEYNLLCDVLDFLSQQARDEGKGDVPGPTKKFLAKDIMSANGSWDDDAFAGGQKAGWEDWLERRVGMGDAEEEQWEVVLK